MKTDSEPTREVMTDHQVETLRHEVENGEVTLGQAGDALARLLDKVDQLRQQLDAALQREQEQRERAGNLHGKLIEQESIANTHRRRAEQAEVELEEVKRDRDVAWKQEQKADDYAKKMKAERDRYKQRCEAMERLVGSVVGDNAQPGMSRGGGLLRNAADKVSMAYDTRSASRNYLRHLAKLADDYIAWRDNTTHPTEAEQGEGVRYWTDRPMGYSKPVVWWQDASGQMWLVRHYYDSWREFRSECTPRDHQRRGIEEIGRDEAHRILGWDDPADTEQESK